MIRRSLLVVVAVFCLFGACAASAFACTSTWNNPAGGAWNSASDWTPSGIPTSGDVCLPDLGTSYAVTLAPYAGGGGYTVNSLTVGTATGSDTETLDIVGQSFVYNGETQNGEGLGLTNGGTINATGSVVLDATAAGGLAGTVGTLGGPAAIGTVGAPNLDNYGHIVAESSDYPAWNEQLYANVLNEPGGNITIASGSLDQMTGNTVSNLGTVTTDAGADYDVTSAGTNDVFTNDGAVANNGTFEVGGQTGTFTQEGQLTGNPVTIEASATLADVSGGGTFTLEYGGPVLEGTIPQGQTVDVRGASDIYQGETQNGTALALGGATVVNDGTLLIDATSDGTKALPSDTVGGPVTLTDGTLDNNGTLTIQTDDAAFTNLIEATVVNASAATTTVSGALKQDTGVAVTNHGTFTLAPGTVYTLLQGGAFTNASDGTLATQIASATSFGSFVVQSPCCSGAGTVAAGGTLTPMLTGGFTPSNGEEFDLVALNGGAFTGTFPTVTNGFTGDYTHETASPAFVGIVYGTAGTAVHVAGTPTAGATPTGTAPTPGTVLVGRAGGGRDLLTLALSCPSGGAACRPATVTATAVKLIRKTKKAKAKRITIGVASASATLAAGGHETLTLHLSAAGRALIKRGGSITVTVKVVSGDKTIKTTSVKVRGPAKPKKKTKKKKA